MQSSCSSGTSEYFYAIQDFLLTNAIPVATFQIANPTDCRDACSKNQAPSGPVQCLSVVFNPSSQQCQLFAVDSTTKSLESQSGVFYLEKICIPGIDFWIVVIIII